MSNDVKVSVILPVYNSEEYLEKCLDDILTQTLNEIELICVDDGSVDSSLKILKDYAEKDNRIKVLHKENGGAASARNMGIDQASGEYLSFLDSDDLFEKDMLEKAYNNASGRNIDVLIFRGDKYDSKNEKFLPMEYSIKKNQLPDKNPFTYRDIKEHVFTFAVGWAWDKLYKREFVINNRLRFQDLRTSNDLYFVFSAFVKADSIYVLNEILVHHRVNVSTSLSVTRDKSWHCFYEAVKQLKYELMKMNVYDELEKGFLNWVVHFSFWNLDTIEGIAYKEVYNLLREKCFPELGLSIKAEDYFENRRYFERIQEVMSMSFEEYVIAHLIEYKKKLEIKNNELKYVRDELTALKSSTTLKAGKAVMCVPIKIKKFIKRKN